MTNPRLPIRNAASRINTETDLAPQWRRIEDILEEGGEGEEGDRGLVISVALSLPFPTPPPLVPTPMVRSEHKTRATALWKYNIILIVSFNTFKSLLILSKSL